jgi:hypothetical protein
MPKRFCIFFAAVAGSLLFAGCQNTLFMGDEQGFDLNAQATSTSVYPVKVNIGYESHTFTMVPPKQPIYDQDNPTNPIANFFAVYNPANVAKGDLLDSIARFTIVKSGTTAMSGSNLLQTGLTIETAFATGQPCIAALASGSSAASPTPAFHANAAALSGGGGKGNALSAIPRTGAQSLKFQ